MKNFQQNLLIFLAIALCGLCAFQWHEQTVQWGEIQNLNEMVFQRNTDIQGYTNSIAGLNNKVEQMDGTLTAVKAAAATDEELLVSQKAAITTLQFATVNLTNTVKQYRVAVDTLEAKLKDAYAGIEKQNEAITNLVSQRDDFVQKLNASAKDRNDVVAKYNDLVKKIQSAADKPPNNSQ
jgi:chromosome segregation ATPase